MNWSGQVIASANRLLHCPVCDELTVQWEANNCRCKNGHEWHSFPGSGVIIDKGAVFPSTTQSVQGQR